MADMNMLITVDPGGTTGVCVIDFAGEMAYVGYQLSRFAAEDMIELMFIARGNCDDVLVACEKYTITGATLKKTRQDDAIKINGTIEWLCHRYNATYEEQTPATAKRLASDDRLKELNLYVPGRGHANDAARHAVLAMERKNTRLLDDDTLFGYNGRINITRVD